MQKLSKNMRVMLIIILGFGFSLHADLLAQSHSSKIVDEPLVFYLNGTKVQKIHESSLASQTSNPIPNQLVIAPGIYRFAGGSYDLRREGLYRFLLPEKMNMQRIVYKKDVDSLLSAICWIHSHGNREDKWSTEELTRQALHSKLITTCAVISHWANSLLASTGIKSRRVEVETLDKLNSYDDGHALIEVWRKKWRKWVLYDVDESKYFINRRTGIPMSLIEFVRAVRDKENYEVIHMSSSTYAVGSFKSPDGYSYAFYMEAILSNMRNWYRRVMQVPFIYNAEEKEWFFYNIAYRKRLKPNSNYKFVPRRTFMEMFYPNTGPLARK